MTPVTTPAQRADRLARAREARADRAALLAAVAAGKVHPADVLQEPSKLAARIRVRQLVSATPGYGRARTDALMAAVPVHPARRVGGLGKRQRERLTAALTRNRWASPGLAMTPGDAPLPTNHGRRALP